mmetsp:Transcript_15430/g.23277  ORF Transcript_15430/g.23277 Transcript_15430/m.23277 type:complete len:327 (-) Transcript_15430:192-1172(-)
MDNIPHNQRQDSQVRGLSSGDGKCVYVIPGALCERDVDALRKECDASVEGYSMEDYSEKSCAVDLFENSMLRDDDPARTQAESYFAERWKHTCLNEFEKNIIRSIICIKLPSLLAGIRPAQNYFLFNEHYVVKPPTSDIIFRWHTDGEEQLQSCPYLGDFLYYSLWCPLDTVSPSNGSLVLPRGTAVQVLHTSCSKERYSASPDTYVEECCYHDGYDHITHQSKTLVLPSGSIVIFPSDVLHASGPNLSATPRRVFYAQYSTDIISAQADPQNSDDAPPPLCFAVPCSSNEVESSLMSTSGAKSGGRENADTFFDCAPNVKRLRAL